MCVCCVCERERERGGKEGGREMWEETIVRYPEGGGGAGAMFIPNRAPCRPPFPYSISCSRGLRRSEGNLWHLAFN